MAVEEEKGRREGCGGRGRRKRTEVKEKMKKHTRNQRQVTECGRQQWLAGVCPGKRAHVHVKYFFLFFYWMDQTIKTGAVHRTVHTRTSIYCPFCTDPREAAVHALNNQIN